MRTLIIFLLFLIISVWLGIEAIQHPGYLLLIYRHWLVQIPLWLALLFLIIIFGLFYLLIASVDQCQFLWFRLKQWFHRRHEYQSYSKTQHGLALLIEGRWKKAEKQLLAGTAQSIEPMINYLAAAKAAQEQGALDRRDHHIQMAYQVAPDAKLAIGLTQAELYIEQHQWEQGLAILTQLHQSFPHHPRILILLEKIYVRFSDWKSLQSLLPSMRKTKLLNAEQTTLFEKNIYIERLNDPSIKNLSALRERWQQVPRYFKKQAEVVCAYTKRLAPYVPITGTDTTKEMETLIRMILKTTWEPTLVRLYTTLPFTQIDRQLVIAGAWLKRYGEHPETFFLLATLCVRAQLWGKAKDYFEACLRLHISAEAILAYGKLLESLNDGAHALKIYKEGLAKIATATRDTV